MNIYIIYIFNISIYHIYFQYIILKMWILYKNERTDERPKLFWALGSKLQSRGFCTFFLFACYMLSVFKPQSRDLWTARCPGKLAMKKGYDLPKEGDRWSYHRKWHMSVIFVVYYVIVAGIYRHILLCMLLHITSVAFRNRSWPFKPLG